MIEEVETVQVEVTRTATVLTTGTTTTGSTVLYAGVAGIEAGGCMSVPGHIFANSSANTATPSTVWTDITASANVINGTANAFPFNTGGVLGGAQKADAKRSVVDSSVRVDVELLDTLMRMVGELVLARNQLVSELDDQKDTALARSAQRLSLVTSELQEQV